MKKKTLILLAIFIVTVSLFFGCQNEDANSKTSYTNTSNTSENITTIRVVKSTDITAESKENNGGSGGAVLTVPKYRTCFYSVPAPFVELVGTDTWYEWMNTIDHTQNTEKMVMVQFVQHFNISREQFDKANLEFAKIIRDKMSGYPCMNPKDYGNQITDEIFNADIIFTFDDEIIRDYYLSPDYPYLYAFEYEEAVANGEYVSQTTDWIDVEALEAEIIAKYGEAEIVKEEEETTVLEEILAIPTEPIETTAEQTEPIV